MTWNVLLAHKGGLEQQKIEEIVAALGGAVTLVTGQSQLVTQLRDTYHDLVMFDGQALEMDHLRFLPNVRAGMPTNATTPTIALVPGPRENQRVAYARAGYYDSFEMPIEPWRLREAIYMVGLAPRPRSDRDRSIAVIEALADPIARAAFLLLQDMGPLTSSEVGEHLPTGMTRQGASGHMTTLVEAGLATWKMSGKRKLYSARHTQIEGCAHWLLELAWGTEPRPFRRRKPRE